MRAGFPRLAVLVLVGLWPMVAAFGQPASEPPPAAAPSLPPPAAETPKPAAGPTIEASQPDTFLLRDNRGNLVPVLGMPFEEFEQLLRAKKGLAPAAAPGFTLENVSLVGSADEHIAELQMTATIRVRQAGWVQVPLRLPTAVVRQAPLYEGPGEHFLAYDEALGGQVCWLNGGDAKPHVVTLQISGGLSSVGDERRLALTLPRATESSLRLTTSLPNLEASLLSGEGIVTTRSLGEERTEIEVVGSAGDVQLAWRPQRDTGVAGPAQLDASGEIVVRIQSERRITSDARLRVRSYGPPLEAFRVRLPPGMELLPVPPAGGFSVTPLAAMSDESSLKQKVSPAEIVEVRLDKPATSTTEVLLRVQREADVTSSGPLMPAQFEVLGAVRQRGTIDFLMDGEWQLDWLDDKSVHRIDLTPDTAAARVVARYEYFRQPCGLELKVAARPSRVIVEPTHVIYVDPQRVRIETLLKYRFRGSRAAGLKFDLGDWNFDRLIPDALIDIPVTDTADAGQLQVPFRAGTAPPTELELKLEAHRTLPPGTERLELTFPRPLADIVAPATIMIFAADNLELTPQIAELMGISPDPTTVRPPGREQLPIVYRDLGGGEPAQFVGHIRPLARTTTTSARATVRIDRAQIQIHQQLEYRIAHEPRRTFVLAAPHEALATGNLQVWMNGEPLPVSPASETKATDPLPDRVQFSTPTDQLGMSRVSVRYSLPLVWDRKGPLPLAIPLVLPVEEAKDQFAGQHVEFVLAEGMTIEPDLEGIDDAAQPVVIGTGTSHAFSWSNPTSLPRWILEAGKGSEAVSTTVLQMWVQTWLSPQIRQERVALRVTTLQESIRIRLPKSVKQVSVQTAIEGQGVPHGFREPGVFVVPLPTAVRGRECVLEVSYELNPPEPQWGVTSGELQTAKIEEAGPPRRVYWQLVLPENEHLVVSPGELAAEMAWPADRWLGGRRPVMDQRQLEAWIKASRQQSLPRGGNEYLFGALGRWPTLTVTIAQRRLIVSLASGAILALGLLLIHAPGLRRPGLLFAFAVIVAGSAIAAPDLALLAGEGAVLGVVVTAGAAAFAWLASGRAIFPAPPVGPLVSRPRETSSTHPAAPRPERSSRISSTAPAHAPVMEARP